MKDYNISELLEYRATHTVKETAEFYETTPNYINLLWFKHRGFERDDKYFSYCKNHTVEEIAEKYKIQKAAAKRDKGIAIKNSVDQNELYKYYLCHTIEQTTKHFEISAGTLYYILNKNGFKGIRHKNYDDFDVEEFKEYAKEHNQSATAEYFGFSIGKTRWLIEKYDVKFRRKPKEVYTQSGKTVWILTKGEEELVFPRAKDIAKYFNRTVTHVQVVSKETGELFGYKVRKVRMIYYP